MLVLMVLMVIYGFDFVLSSLLDDFLRGKCLSNKLPILLIKSWNDLGFQREFEESYSSQCFLYFFKSLWVRIVK